MRLEMKKRGGEVLYFGDSVIYSNIEEGNRSLTTRKKRGAERRTWGSPREGEPASAAKNPKKGRRSKDRSGAGIFLS